jgi:hypothetical protein
VCSTSASPGRVPGAQSVYGVKHLAGQQENGAGGPAQPRWGYPALPADELTWDLLD